MGSDKLSDQKDKLDQAGHVLDLSELAGAPAVQTPQAAAKVTPPPQGLQAGQLHTTSQSEAAGPVKATPSAARPTPPKPAPATESESRLERAARIERSQHVSRFGSLHASPNAEETIGEEEVEQPPRPTPVPQRPKPNVGDEIARRHVRAPQAAAAQQVADLTQLSNEIASKEKQSDPVPAAESAGPPLPIEDDTEPNTSIFKRLFRWPRLSSATAAIISILLLAGYVTYLNLPNIALRVAASRAGFSARMPRYLPEQYSFSGPVAYGPGQIVVNFGASEGANIAITQRQTDLDSESLLENHIEPNSTKPPLTFHERGLTIYVYNGNKASWVNRGIWYTIEGNNDLNAEQVIRIASSL